MILAVNRAALHVEDTGEGPPVALLHGHALDLRVWDGVVPGLLAHGCRVVRYDQRGHGRSSSPAAGYRWSEHVGDLVALLEALGAAPAHLVGLSKGAGIALEAAVRRPGLVRSLALIGPLLPGFAMSAETVESFRLLARSIRAEGVERAARTHWLDHPLLRHAHARPGGRERLEAMVLGFPAGEYLAARDPADDTPPAAGRLGEITVPTLVVTGQHEVEDFRAMAGEIAAGVPGARCAVVADSGHLVPLEQPAATLALLIDFLAGG